MTELEQILGAIADLGPVMSSDDPKPDGWHTHEAEQLRSWMRLSCLERLRWLDQAKCFAALALEAANERRATSANGEGHGMNKAADGSGITVRVALAILALIVPDAASA